MNDIRRTLAFLKLAAQGPSLPASMGGQSTGMIGGPNPIQKAVAEQQAAMQGQATPQGNPEIVKAEQASIQAQQQAAQQIAQTQQQAAQEVMKAQQQAAQAQMQAQQQTATQVQKLQAELDKARSDKQKAETAAEVERANAQLSKVELEQRDMLHKVDSEKTEILNRQNPAPELQAPPPDYTPLFKRLGGRISKAVGRLSQVAPAMKVAEDVRDRSWYRNMRDQATAGSPASGSAWQGPANTRAGFGNRLQDTGYFNDDIILSPRAYTPNFGTIGNQVLSGVRKLLWKEPDYAQYFATDPFSVGGGSIPQPSTNPSFSAGLMTPMTPMDMGMAAWQGMLQNGAQGFLNTFQ